MHLVVDVGSTDTKIGLFAPDDLRPIEVVRLSSDEAASGGSLVDVLRRLAEEYGREDDQGGFGLIVIA